MESRSCGTTRVDSANTQSKLARFEESGYNSSGDGSSTVVAKFGSTEITTIDSGKMRNHLAVLEELERTSERTNYCSMDAKYGSSGTDPRRSWTDPRSQKSSLYTCSSSNIAKFLSRAHTEEALDAITFLPTETFLLRGTPLRKLLRHGAKVLSSNTGDNWCFQLSHAVDNLDYFISHNWSIPRFLKFFSLVLHFNLDVAVGVSIMTTSLCFWLTILGVVPRYDYEDVSYLEGYLDKDTQSGLCAGFFAVPAFMFTLVFKHELERDSSQDVCCFLDRTCIHQTDLELKRRGIEKLGAFLDRSSRILILYSPLYTQKMWTIYEIACFTTLHPSSCIDLVHLSLTKYFYALVIVLYLFSSIGMRFYVMLRSRIWSNPSSLAYITFGWLFTFSFVVAALTRHAHRTLASTWGSVSEFEIRNSLCFDEKDRTVVQDIIASLMVIQGHSKKEDGPRAALDAFNALVRHHVLHTMKVAVGPSPLPLKYTQIMVLLVIFPCRMDAVAAALCEQGASNINVWFSFLFATSSAFGNVPVILELLSWLMSKNMNLRGGRDWLWMFACTGVTASLGLLFQVVGWYFLNKAKKEKEVLMFLVINIFFFSAPICVAIAQKRIQHMRLYQLDVERQVAESELMNKRLLRESISASGGVCSEELDVEEKRGDVAQVLELAIGAPLQVDDDPAVAPLRQCSESHNDLVNL